jgi:hypothetical protein
MVADGNNPHDETSITTFERLGNVAFLNTVLACIDRRCKLLGLDAPEKHVSLVLAKVYTGFDPERV